MHRRLAAATALCATLLLGACTPDAPQPPPQPSSGPTEPSASSSPTPTSPSPTTSEHADLLEVQELYKAEFAAENEVLKQGGATSLPSDIRARTTGTYQRDVLAVLRNEKKRGEHLVVPGKLRGIKMRRWAPSKVVFDACEDFSGLKSADKDGHIVHRPPGTRGVQTVTVIMRDGRWRIAYADAKVVKNFRGSGCDGKWYS
jgi:hypothetical protein